MVDPINEALEKAHAKLDELLSARTIIDKEIVDWKRVIDSLLAVSESDGSDPSDIDLQPFVAKELGSKRLKFTDAIRMILHETADHAISVPEVRDRLINLGFNLSKYKQQLVPIHNTLKRLEEQGEVKPIKNEAGQTLGYKWISAIERALSAEPEYQRLARMPVPADHPLQKLRSKPNPRHKALYGED
jgi:hypothetical protein